MDRRTFCQLGAALSLTSVHPLLRGKARLLAQAGRRVLLGVDYYPDQTPEPLWAEDAAMMAQAGINNVRIAEFAWSLMEPAEGEYRLEWLARAVRLLHAHGIDCILGNALRRASPVALDQVSGGLARERPGRGDDARLTAIHMPE